MFEDYWDRIKPGCGEHTIVLALSKDACGKWGSMTSEVKPARRDPILFAWLGLSVALNVVGLASLVDGIVVWATFIQEIVEIYHEVIREPIEWAAQLIWPASWPRIPAAFFDLLVVWSCLFLSTNIALYRSAGVFLLSEAFAKIRGFRSFFGFVLVSTLMFITIPFGIIRHLLSANEYRYNVLFPYRREMTFSILHSLLFVIGIFIVLLFVNFQISHIGASS